jgi:MscS family membrane protein
MEQFRGLSQPFVKGGTLKVCQRSTWVARTVALVVLVSLFFAATASTAAAGDRASGHGPGLPVSVALVQDTPVTPDVTQEPTPADTPEPPGETAEPTPSETAEPPPEATQQPTSEPPEPEATPTGTPAPEETIEPPPTETASAAPRPTATATPTATRAVLVWPTDWPLGTVRIGEEPGPPTEPIQVQFGEWLRLGLALIVVALVAIFGGRLLHRFLRSVLARQHLEVDETLLVQLRPLLSWWLAAIGFHIAVWLVDFQDEHARDLFVDLAFLAYLGVATFTVWQVADRAIDLYTRRLAAEGQIATSEKLRPVMQRWARVLIVLFSALIALGRLDIGFSVPTILILLAGLTISLAARDTLTDIIAGFFILIDRPFRIGDRIEVQGVETWAQVLNIGLRTSVLLTRHNVEIIVPNSTISKNQVINYSYPDPRYRMQTHVGIAFGTDIEHARRVMIDAVRQADYVLPDEPVEALYVEIGDSAMIFRVRWWIDFHRDWEMSYDHIHTALRRALAKAGIESPDPSQRLKLRVDDRTLAEVWQVWQEEGGTGSSV